MKVSFMKKLIFLLVLFCYTELVSQVVNFNAINSRTLKQVDLDSVEVIKENGSRYILIKPVVSVNLNVLGVETEYSIKHECNVIASNQQFRMYSDLSLQPNLTIEIYSYNLSLIKSQSVSLELGTYEINVRFGNLPSDLYFVLIKNGKNIDSRKVLYFNDGTSTGEPIISFSKSEFSKIEQLNDKYSFIGYATGFKPDTVVLSNPVNNDNVSFNLLETSIYKFRNCLIELNLPVVAHTGTYSYKTAESKYDTIYYNHKFLLTNMVSKLHITYGSCDTLNYDSTININKCMYGGYGSDIHFQATVSEFESKLINVKYKFFEEIPKNSSTNTIYSKTDFSFEISSIPITNKLSNRLRAFLNISELSQVQTANLDYKSDWSGMKGGPMIGSSTTNFKGLYPMFDKATISIELFE